MTIDEITKKQLLKIKSLYNYGLSTLESSQQYKAFSILNFHDCVELLMILYAKSIDVKIDNIPFMGYWEEIKKKAEKDKNIVELEHKCQMRKLNEIRVNIKHKGIFPDSDEINDCQVYTKSFLELHFEKCFGVNFNELSLVNLIEDEKLRKMLKDAEELILNDEYKESINLSEKAFTQLIDKYDKSKLVFDSAHIYSEVSALLYEDQYLSIINQRFETIFESIIILSHNINFKRFIIFKIIIDQSSKKESINKISNANFCIQFVVDSYLKMQEYEFNPDSLIEES